MTDIDILHPSAHSSEQNRLAVELIAEKLRDQLGLQTEWQGDVLNFQRSGVDGHITVAPGHVQVSANLGFPFSAMRGMVEAEIRRVLADKLG
ncbi:MAG: polyhydroxyalkanoic acid system family protein [Pseudomonadota bacterium]|nr:polyhydroxyalkanoic acid system family protein [Pseudomonadota bacterium]